MPYDYYPAIDETMNFSPAVRAALAKSLDLRNTVLPMTTVQRNNLVGADLWNGRLILNTDTGRINRYDLATVTWVAVAEFAEMVASDNAFFAAVQSQLSLRNKIRNGDQNVAQRGNGPWTTSGYTLDGHKLYQSGAACSVVRGVFGLANQTVRSDCVITMSTPAVAAGDYVMMTFPIEDVRTLAGRVCTLSIKHSSSVAGRVVAFSIRQSFGSGGSPSAVTDTPIGIFTLGTTGLDTAGAYQSMTFTMPSVAAKVVGSNEDSQVELRLWMATGSGQLAMSGMSAAQGTQAVFTYAFTEIQLENGSLASPFERLPQQMQLAWCQRYFWRALPGGTSIPMAMGLCSGAITSIQMIQYPVQMRAIPTLIVNNVGSLATYSGAGGFNGVTGVGIYAFGLQAGMLSVAAGGNTVGGISMLCSNAAGSLDISAEL
jgi:hypothetical protein